MKLQLTILMMVVAIPVLAETQHSLNTKKRPSALAARRLQLDSTKVNDPNTTDEVHLGTRGEAVVRAAILLDTQYFSPGEIGTLCGTNMEKAIKAFQSANGLPETGIVDRTTWDKLNTGSVQTPTAPPGQPNQNQVKGAVLETYIVALEDVEGPFTHLPHLHGRNAGERTVLAESHLKRLNYESPLQLLAEKFHSSPALLVALNRRARFDKAGTKLLAPNVLMPDLGKASSVVVDGSTGSVSALDPSGTILAFYPATLGSEHDPLPIGEWKVTEISWYPRYKYNPSLFWDSENKHPRAVLAPGPKNPVGEVWIGLSKEHYGIHGTPEPSTIGKTQSHGCIRLTNWDATQLGKMVQVGTPVTLKK